MENNIPKDSLTGIELDNLQNQRLVAAQEAFQNEELPPIAATKSWLPDGVFYSIGVFWEGQGNNDSTFGSFGVEFAPNSTTILRSWTNF